MSSLAAPGIIHCVNHPRHAIDCRSSLSTTNILSPALSLPIPHSIFTSQLNYSLGYNHSTKPLPSRPFLHRPASRRTSGFNPKVDDGILGVSRDWSRSIGRSDLVDDDDLDDYDDDDDEEEDRSLDLFLKFVQNIYRKISKRARKAVRSVLPTIIPSNLVGFSVDGVLVLAFLWVLKAFLEVRQMPNSLSSTELNLLTLCDPLSLIVRNLENMLRVVCTLGSVVFVSILLTRVVWMGVTYLQESRILRMNGDDDDDDGDRRAWTGARPAT
ncbi:Protein SHORT HYPOCOTYL IN WHITE LIGHT 1 [Linum perenne]